jgi:hypothetical protein
MGKKSGSGIRNEQPGSYFLEFRNHFFGLKYLNSLRIRDLGWKQFGSGILGSGMEKSRIRVKHPGSAIAIVIRNIYIRARDTTIDLSHVVPYHVLKLKTSTCFQAAMSRRSSDRHVSSKRGVVVGWRRTALWWGGRGGG